MMLVIIGVISGAAVISQHNKGQSKSFIQYQVLEKRAENLRAKGVIVENYYLAYKEPPNNSNLTRTIIICGLSILLIYLGSNLLCHSFKLESRITKQNELNPKLSL